MYYKCDFVAMLFWISIPCGYECTYVCMCMCVEGGREYNYLGVHEFGTLSVYCDCKWMCGRVRCISVYL